MIYVRLCVHQTSREGTRHNQDAQVVIEGVAIEVRMDVAHLCLHVH